MQYIHHIQVIAIMCQIYVKAPYCKQMRITYEILYDKKQNKTNKKIQYLSTFTFCSSHSQNNSPEALGIEFYFQPFYYT